MQRSRVLWDRTRRRSSTEWKQQQQWRHYMAAILYELQPVRGISWQATRQAVQRGATVGWRIVCQDVPRLVFRQGLSILVYILTNYWKHCLALAAYGAVVTVAHQTLSAGPAVVILTLLVLVFTVGLGNDTRLDGELSAYAVFNRGMQRILGSVDEAALLQQHVGGGAWMGNQNERRQDDVPRRRNAPPQEPAPPPPPAAPPNAQDDDDDDAPPPPPPNARRRNTKKSRNNKRNAEQRREMQRQRQAAREMGFANENDEAAMLRLVGE